MEIYLLYLGYFATLEKGVTLGKEPISDKGFEVEKEEEITCKALKDAVAWGQNLLGPINSSPAER